jgi:hypothetical protein
MRIADFLEDSGRIVAYYPELVRLTKSVTANVLLCQFVYWRGKERGPNGWLYKTQPEITKETGLTRTEQSTARKRLRELGVLEEEKRGVPARLFYRVNLKKLLKLWIEIRAQSQSSQFAGFLQTECADPANNIQRLPSGNLNAQLARAQSPDDNAASLSPSGEVVKSDLTQGVKWVDGTSTYPDKLLSQPVLNSDKSNEYVQPTYRSFEFENSFPPEEGSFPLWGGEDNLEFVPNASIVDRMNASTIEPNHIPDVGQMVTPQPEPPTEEKQPPLVTKDRIRKQKRVPPPRPRKLSREAQLYAYRYDPAGWLQLPPANGINSQPRAIAVRAIQELILQDYGGHSKLAAEWEQDDDGFWRVLDHKHCDEELDMEEMLSKRGRLPLKALRNYAVTFAGLDQATFNEDLQRLYEVALEYCQEYGRLDMLEDGERWIDQPIFDDYLGAYLQSA